MHFTFIKFCKWTEEIIDKRDFEKSVNIYVLETVSIKGHSLILICTTKNIQC